MEIVPVIGIFLSGCLALVGIRKQQDDITVASIVWMVFWMLAFGRSD